MRVFHNSNPFQRHTPSCGGKIKYKQLNISCTDQMDKFKPTENYFVYDFETMKELINNKKEDTAKDNSSSLSSSSSSTPKKSTEKIIHIVLLSATCAAKTKTGIKTGYFDCRNGSDFIIKWLESLIEVAGEVTKDNMYEFVKYTI
jgi:hypothetical protein